MFTGIITAIGAVESIEKSGDWIFEISTPWDCAQIELGASIACSGACLTVIRTEGAHFWVSVSDETLSKTNLSGWSAGDKINLERALKIGDELGGHIVSGHVDGMARVVSIRTVNDSVQLRLDCPEHLKAFIAAKGSVCLDGISLTVNDVEDTVFMVNIIPHTWQQTTLQYAQTDSLVNLEIDMLARYMMRMLDVRGMK